MRRSSDGSPLIAARHAEARFTHILLCELDPANAAALRQRLAADTRVQVFEGDCDDQIERIAAAIPPHRLNLALIDPFGVTSLRFETLARLARFERMDILLHFPTNDLVRNLRRHPDRVSAFLGTDGSRTKVAGPRDVPKLRDILRGQLLPFGYQKAEIFHEPYSRTRRTRGSTTWS